VAGVFAFDEPTFDFAYFPQKNNVRTRHEPTAAFLYYAIFAIRLPKGDESQIK
jgi:hypothetical protein